MLEQFFQDLFSKTTIQAPASGEKKDDFTGAQLKLNDNLPSEVLAHLEQNGVQLKQFAEGYDFQATTEMLIDRVDSLIQAYLSSHMEKKELLQFQRQYVETIKSDALKEINTNLNIDTLRNSEKLTLDKLKKLLERFCEYLEDEVFIKLYRSYKNNASIHFDSEEFDKKDYLQFIEKLRKAEIENISSKGRKTFVNLDSKGYFTAQIPLGMKDGQPYTHQSYKRDTGELSNYVLHVMGYRDPSTGEVEIFDQSTRASNYDPIDIDLKNRYERFRGTQQQVQQGIDSVKKLNLNKKIFTQISLLSTLSEKAPNIDVQQGYEQTLHPYLAFLVKSDDSMEMRYFVEGVNMMRSNFLSDPLKFQINFRFYNQLTSDLKNENDFLKNLFSNELLENSIKNSWDKNIKPLIENLKNCNNETALKAIDAIKMALAKHHELEEQLFEFRREAWKQNQAKIKKLLASDNQLQELNNFYFLLENDRYQTREYNYQLQACIHRLSSSLGHHVAVNCNDSEDRTGELYALLMAIKQWIKNHGGLAPDLTNKKVLKEIQALSRKQQAVDVGMENTEANGTRGQEVHTKDVADNMINPEATLMAALTKKVYHPILKLEHWVAKLKELPAGNIVKAAGSFIKQKLQLGIVKPAGNFLNKLFGTAEQSSVKFLTSAAVIFAGLISASTVTVANTSLPIVTPPSTTQTLVNDQGTNGDSSNSELGQIKDNDTPIKNDTPSTPLNSNKPTTDNNVLPTDTSNKTKNNKRQAGFFEPLGKNELSAEEFKHLIKKAPSTSQDSIARTADVKSTPTTETSNSNRFFTDKSLKSPDKVTAYFRKNNMDLKDLRDIAKPILRSESDYEPSPFRIS